MAGRVYWVKVPRAPPQGSFDLYQLANRASTDLRVVTSVLESVLGNRRQELQ